ALDASQTQAFMRLRKFATGGKGAKSSRSGYLYRISSLSKLMTYCPKWTSSSPRKEDQPWVAFRLMEKEIKRTGKWIPLDKYAQETYSTPRGFTFWSSQEIDPSDLSKVISSIHKLGIPNDWLEEYSIVLMCNIDDLASGPCIPTVLDAFTSHIFHPTRESRAPEFGIAISLSLSKALAKAATEFVLGPVPVSAIKLHPILVPRSTKPYIGARNPLLIDLLKAYYDEL